MAELKAKLDFGRVATAIDVILTDIYGEYVAVGSPTKLGGLRFLDVQCSKTFAFEKTRPMPKDEGNLLIVSAPAGDVKELEKAMRKGPHGKDIREFQVRASSDAGKGGKNFVEVAYFLPTGKWLTDKDIESYAKKHGIANGNDVIVAILRDNVLPYAREVMKHFVDLIRAETPPI